MKFITDFPFNELLTDFFFYYFLSQFREKVLKQVRKIKLLIENK